MKKFFTDVWADDFLDGLFPKFLTLSLKCVNTLRDTATAAVAAGAGSSAAWSDGQLRSLVLELDGVRSSQFLVQCLLSKCPADPATIKLLASECVVEAGNGLRS